MRRRAAKSDVDGVVDLGEHPQVRIEHQHRVLHRHADHVRRSQVFQGVGRIEG